MYGVRLVTPLNRSRRPLWQLIGGRRALLECRRSVSYLAAPVCGAVKIAVEVAIMQAVQAEANKAHQDRRRTA